MLDDKVNQFPTKNKIQERDSQKNEDLTGII